MQDHDRLALWMSGLLDIDTMPAGHLDQALIEGLDMRIKVRACALLPCDPIHGPTI